MNSIAFIDTEVEPKNGRILDIGAVKGNGETFHSDSVADFARFLSDVDYVCGHNIINHDLKYLLDGINSEALNLLKNKKFIDTLFLSPLLFPLKPYHALLKDDKLQTFDINNPLNDSLKAKDLFFDEVSAFERHEDWMRRIIYNLLKGQRQFGSFFSFLGYKQEEDNVDRMIKNKFKSQICEEANINKIIHDNPIELAYCLALINTDSRYSITPPWVLKNFKEYERVMYLLRGNPCAKGCKYCDSVLDIYIGLKSFFGHDKYRTYDGEPLQEKAVKAAVENKSLLAVFPTGGGKSITFQVPALISGVAQKGLTVVISPLQSLMKDQVDNLEKEGITDGVTINGLLDPIERAKSFERVENGSASILYISPESLRSKTIERLLIGRNVVRFVIDEAHCFSAWGQDFRVDYLYIGDFIKQLQEKKNLQEPIPVSCFTATAKQKVIEDICNYFKEKLSLELEVYKSGTARSNLHYSVSEKKTEEEKYYALRDLIVNGGCPTIVYVSRTHKAEVLSQRLTADGYEARPFHGKMDKRDKTENQDAFIKGEVQIIVATSAFGMGVDKKDVGMVIHYDISDSLENYIQEAGRAGRDESITAECFILFSEDDLSRHFALLNQTKINIKEIQQIWKAIKDLTRLRSRVSQSALEIARKAGWDDTISDIETRVTTAIAALEEAGYVKRGQNIPRVYANSILVKNAEEAINRVNASNRFTEEERTTAIRIIKALISSRSRVDRNDIEAESRVDYLADRLGIKIEDVIRAIYLLRDEKILSDTKDLNAFIRKSNNKNRSQSIFNTFLRIEKYLLEVLTDDESTINIKEINECLEKNGTSEVTPNKIKTILNFWAIKGWIRQHPSKYTKNYVNVLCLQDKEILTAKLAKRHELAQFLLEYLFEKSKTAEGSDNSKEEVLVEFSVVELREAFENVITIFTNKATIDEIEDALFYLSKIGALKIEGGFLVAYRVLDIEKVEQDNKRKYKAEDYQKLNDYYQNRVQQIHIVGEYAKKVIQNYSEALQFVDDYFQLNYTSFLNKYFKGNRQNEILKNITPARFKSLFGELSPIQLNIINDNASKYIVVIAGPGSGKTRILVHKLASLLLMEDVKHEQLLMLTFSRASAIEFKKRLQKLVGNAANYIDIKTFHSYCFDLLGRMGTLEKSDEIIKETIERIKNGEVEINRITKTVLVIDEAQDMNADEFELISTLIEQNEEMRVIAVGDDDQNIYEFRGASAQYLERLITEKDAVIYEMLENYRSRSNIVDFTNQFLVKISHRLKKTPINAIKRDLGTIKWTRNKGEKIAIPVVNDIMSDELSGTTCVLTKTNEEAFHIVGLLSHNGIKAKLIQSNDGFNLYNLLEIRFFIEQLELSEHTTIIDDDSWNQAMHSLAKRFQTSSNLEACVTILKDFAITNPKIKYKSDFEIHIRESKLEDGIIEKTETVYVSTIHKSKGREFDNVYIMLSNFNYGTDAALRQLYVAMTRAKTYLNIHSNDTYFNFINTEGLKKVMNNELYSSPARLVVQLSHKDLWLDSFHYNQEAISCLSSGDKLIVDKNHCLNSKGQIVIRFSKHFISKIEDMKRNFYLPKAGKINHIVYWKKEDAEDEIRIVLPEIYFEHIESGDLRS